MIKYFYSLYYFYVDTIGNNQSLQIGYFSCKNNAIIAKEQIKDKPGFKNSGGNFEIQKIGVVFSKEISNQKNIILYELSHEYTDNDGYDNFVIFGIYATYEEAEQVKKSNEKLSPFKYFPNDFCISECKVDVYGWQEGFTSW